MNGKKLTINVVGLIFTFALLTVVMLYVLSNGDSFLYDESVIMPLYGFGCVVLGMELRDYISKYLLYNYCQESEEIE